MTPAPTTPPTFSVVIPAFNAERTIVATIRSVLAQSRSDFEILVVDDASSDGTAAAVEELGVDPRVRLLRQPANRGVSAARNTAIRHAVAPIVAFLDSDDLWLPNYLERMASALEARPDAALAYTDAWILDGRSGQFLRKTTSVAYGSGPDEPPVDRAALIGALLHSNFVFYSVLIRRDVFDQVGLFDEDLAVAEDYELWLKIAVQGLRMVRVRDPLVIYRRGPGTLSSDPVRLETLRREVLRRIAESADVPEPTRALAVDLMRVADRRIAAFSDRLRLTSVLYRTRLRLVPVKHRLLGRFLRYRTAPAPIAHAFAEFRASGQVPD
jgi:glycosyltransferase involved in cell wall biosynthesis